jgi:hypothetical protein
MQSIPAAHAVLRIAQVLMVGPEAPKAGQAIQLATGYWKNPTSGIGADVQVIRTAAGDEVAQVLFLTDGEVTGTEVMARSNFRATLTGRGFEVRCDSEAELVMVDGRGVLILPE